MSILVTLAVMLLPGLAMVRRNEWERAEPIELAGVAFAGSAAFWAVSFWLLRWAPLSWRAFALVSMAAGLVWMAVGRRKGIGAAAGIWRRERIPFLLQASFIIACVALRLLFGQTHLAYSGGDMTAHAAMAEEIVLADGFPATQEPLAPIPRFGEVPPGFHALSALVTLLTKLPTFRSTILVASLAMAAMALTLYALLRALELSRAASAAGAAGALLLARNPQLFLQWGGAPSILAAAIGLLVLRDLLSLPEEPGVGRALRVGALAAGVLLTHVLPAVGLIWLAVPVLLLRLLAGHGPWRHLILGGVLAAVIALLLSLPFLLSASRPLSNEAKTWAHGWFRAETHGAVELEQRFAPFLGKAAGPATWPFFLVTYLGALPVLLMLAGLGMGLCGPRRGAALLSILLLAMHGLLFTGALSESLPGWPALYPTRTALWLAIPLAIALAELAARVARLPGRRPVALAILMVFAVAFAVEGWRLSAFRVGSAFYGQARGGRGSVASVLANEAAGGAFWVTTFSRDVAAVTPEDLAAFAWTRTHTPPDAVFANNPGDGGSLLPAAAHRKILDPHYYWFFDRAEMEAWKARTRIDFVYVGAEPAFAWARRWRAEDLDRDPRVELVYRSGRARIYRVREPFATRFR